MKKYKLKLKGTEMYLAKRKGYFEFSKRGTTWGSKPSKGQQGHVFRIDGKYYNFDDFEIITYTLTKDETI